MTPARGGRHCAACVKTVVDFTQQTDAEILAYFRQAGAGRTCGRFRAGQLGRPLRPALPASRPQRWQLWVAGLLAATLSVQSCQTTAGEVPPTTAQHLAPPPLAAPTVDSATMGAAQPLLGDSVLVSAAPAGGGELNRMLLGEPAIE